MTLFNFAELSESRITQMTRILRVSLFVVAQFIASLFESRILADFCPRASEIHFRNRGFNCVSGGWVVIESVFCVLNFSHRN